jgi:hypothetical protein
MAMPAGLKQQSRLTGLAACLFAAGFVLALVVLYHENWRGGPLLWIAALLLLATLGCWVASARAGEAA